MPKHAFTDLSIATYCPRKLYYDRREDEDPPDVSARRALAFRYDDLIDAPDDRLADHPIDVTPRQFRRNLLRVRDRFESWPDLVDPDGRNVVLTGRECRGIAHKVIDGEPPAPSIVVTGTPPERGVWRPQSVRAVAAAKALAWERERPIERAFVEYATRGLVREVPLTTRRRAAYRTAIRTVESIDGPPPRIDHPAKCDACEYREECGVRSRSLRSLLG